MTNTQRNGAGVRAVEETVLRIFQREGYAISRPPGEQGGAFTVLEARDHRALLRFQWGQGNEWGPEIVRAFRSQMDDLKATRGYLITNGLFADGAHELAPQLAISLTDGPALKEALFATAPPLERISDRQEPPLPFEKYIPWFVVISLVVIAALVLILVSIALAMTPVEPVV